MVGTVRVVLLPVLLCPRCILPVWYTVLPAVHSPEASPGSKININSVGDSGVGLWLIPELILYGNYSYH